MCWEIFDMFLSLVYCLSSELLIRMTLLSVSSYFNHWVFNWHDVHSDLCVCVYLIYAIYIYIYTHTHLLFSKILVLIWLFLALIFYLLFVRLNTHCLLLSTPAGRGRAAGQRGSEGRDQCCVWTGSDLSGKVWPQQTGLYVDCYSFCQHTQSTGYSMRIHSRVIYYILIKALFICINLH